VDPEYIYRGGGQYHVRIVFYWLPKTDILKFTSVAESMRGGVAPCSLLDPCLWYYLLIENNLYLIISISFTYFIFKSPNNYINSFFLFNEILTIYYSILTITGNLLTINS
jgi:hypothetical protein